MKWKALLAVVFLPVLASAQVNITEATYWFDDNLASAVTVPIAAAQQVDFDSSISTAGLSTGPHLVTIRFRQSNGKFSAPITKQFMKLPSGGGTGNKTIVACQYWFDNNYAGAITQSVGPAEQLNTAVAASVAGLSKGPHIIHMRFRDNGNIWSGTTSQQFFKTNGTGAPGGNVMTAYRYWVDTAISQMRIGYFQSAAQNGYLFTPFNFSGLDTGKHWVHYQFKDTMQVWSSVVSDSFFKFGRPRIDYVTPSRAGNKGDVTLKIYGAGLRKGSIVKLVRVGHADIIAPDSFTVVNAQGNLVNAILDLRNVDTGSYDLEVVVPNDTVMVLSQAFKVESGTGLSLSSSLVGPNGFRPGLWGNYSLIIGNNSNNDAHGVPVWITVPRSAEFAPNFRLFKSYELFNIAQDTFYDTVPLSIDADTVMGVIKPVKIIGFYLPLLTAKSNTTLNFKMRYNLQDTLQLRYWVDEPYFGSPLKDWFGPCLGGLIEEAMGAPGIPPVVPCLYSAFDIGYQIGGVVVETALTGTTAVSMGEVFFEPVKNCVISILPDASKTARIIKKLNDGYSRGSLLGDCMEPPEPPKTQPLAPLMSQDPNAKYGVLGYGTGHYFTSTASSPYLVAFENEPTANAAAQTVKIVDTLDMEVFDKTTFSLGSITVADKVVKVPSGSKSFEGYVDYRPNGNHIILKIEAALNDTNGVATWLFTTLDPETEQATTNPIAGFLPPNVNSPEGQGSVSFAIKTKDGLPTNTVIKNKASIYFDTNPPIVTEPWINTIDISAPGSEVAALPEYTKDTVVKVRWSGKDTGAGIRDYTIYVSENGNPYRIWKFQTTDTAADFIGQFDSTYAFYSVATDHVGNKEKVPTNHDAVTRLIRPEETVSGGISVFPNPTSGTFTIQGRHEREQDMSVTVTNITGQFVQRDEIDNTGQPFKHTLDLSRLSKGYYNVTLRAGTWKQVFKLIKL